jgi:hypothetical protein
MELNSILSVAQPQPLVSRRCGGVGTHNGSLPNTTVIMLVALSATCVVSLPPSAHNIVYTTVDNQKRSKSKGGY